MERKDDASSSSPDRRTWRTIREFIERDPEFVTRDAVLLIAGCHVVVMIYFVLRCARDVMCISYI